MKTYVQRLPKEAIRHDWITPTVLWWPIHEEFKFTLDVCATAESARCKRFFTPDDDGLAQDWRGACWMNPPFGRTIGKWVEKAAFEASKGATVVALLPARTDTAWWHEHCVGREIRFIKGRVAFIEASTKRRPVEKRVAHNAPFPCVLVIFRPTDDVEANRRRIAAGQLIVAHQPVLPGMREMVA